MMFLKKEFHLIALNRKLKNIELKLFQIDF